MILPMKRKDVIGRWIERKQAPRRRFWLPTIDAPIQIAGYYQPSTWGEGRTGHDILVAFQSDKQSTANRIPNAGDLVLRAIKEQAVIWGEGHAGHAALVAFQGKEQLTFDRIPEAGG